MAFQMDVVEFALRFVRLMRRNKECTNKPSARQAVSIPRLLIARAIRSGKLTPDDLVFAAVATSSPENQALAEETAREILMRWGEPLEETEEPDEELALELEEIQRMLREHALERMIDESGMGMALGYAQKLRTGPRTPQQNAALTMLRRFKKKEDVPDWWEVAQRGITTDEELLQIAKELAKRCIGSLSPDELKACCDLGLGSEVSQSSPRSWERTLAKVLSSFDCAQDKGEMSLTDAFKSEDLSVLDAIKLLNFARMLFPDRQAELKQLASELAERIQSLEELYEALRSLGWLLPQEGLVERALEDALNRYDFDEGYELAKGIDRHTPLNVREEFLKKWLEHAKQTGEFPSLLQLAKSGFESDAWLELLREAAKRLKEAISHQPSAISNAANELFHIAHELMKQREKTDDPFVANQLLNLAMQFGNWAIEQAVSPQQLRALVKALRATELPIFDETVMKRGKELGMSEEEIWELLAPSFELLRKAIKAGLEDFERLFEMVQAVEPNAKQIQELVEAALECDNSCALGALGHFNLSQALRAAQQQGGQQAMEQMVSSLTAGSGENLLVQWFKHRDNLPQSIAKEVKELAKKLLLELGIHYSRARLGSSESGPMPLSQVRPFSIGDELDMVDVEESLENVLSKGKTIDLVDYDDLLVHQTEQGRRAVCIELDISGSMTGEKLAYMAICTTMLVYGMRKEELALCFFESNCHKVKEIDEEVELDELAEQLLNLRAMGGTVITQALEWAKGNFEKTAARERLNVVFTDSEIFDLEQAMPLFSSLKSMDVRLVLVVPAEQYSVQNAHKLIQQTKAFLVKVDKWQKFPDVISQVVRG